MSSKRDANTAGGDEDGAAGDNSDGGTTVALQRKRSRRVSFAENTSVHFFDRDEEYNEAHAVAEESAAAKIVEHENEELKMLLEFHDSQVEKPVDVETDDDEDDDFPGPSFLKLIGSPSPGSTIGSATSNDEGDFFGPVSASFIRHGRLSDSAASEDNREITLDSTSFPMHFRSLARSDTGADLRTPTGVSLYSPKSNLGVDLKTPAGVHLAFEQKSPTNDTVGSFMDLTLLKPISHSSSGNVNCNSGSSDMSLIVDNPSKYNYGRLPLEIAELLTEDTKSSCSVSASPTGVASSSPRDMESKYMTSKVNERPMSIMDNGNEVSSFHKRLGKEKAVSVISPKSGFLSSTSDAFPSENLIDNLNSLPGPSPRVKTSLHLGMQSTSDNIQSESLMMELISSSTAKGKEVQTSNDSQVKLTCLASPDVGCSPGKGRRIPDLGSLGMNTSVVTPQDKIASSFLNKNAVHDKSAPSVPKSILKHKSLPASPLSSFLTVQHEIADNRALYIFKPSPISTFLSGKMNSLHNEHLDRPVSGSVGQLLSGPKDKHELVHPSLQDRHEVEDPSRGGHTIVKVNDDHLRPKILTPANMVPTATDSLLPEVIHEHVREKKAITTPHKFSSLDDASITRKVLPEDTGLFLDNSLLRSRLKNLQTFIGHDSDSKGRAINANISTADADESCSLSHGSRLQPGELVLNSSNQTDQTLTVDFSSRQLGTLQNIETVRTPTGRLNDNIQTGMDNSMFGSDHPGGGSEAAASVHRNMKEVIVRKNLLDSFTRSPSKNGPQVISSKSIGMPEVENVLSPVHNKSNSPGRKRTKKPAVEGNRNKAAGCSRSPKIQKIRDNDVAGLSLHNKDDQGTPVDGHKLKHWTDIYPKFLKEAENVFCSSVDKLNLLSIELLEDHLVCLRRSKAYEIIRNRIIDQKRASGDVLHYDRVCEARNLLHKIIFEKRKLQLVRAKKQKMLEKVQKLKIGIEESQKLKVDYPSKSMGHAEGDIVDYHNLLHTKNRTEDTGDKIMAMKQTLEALDRKASKLMETLTTAHKIKVEPSCDTIESANDHLIKKLCCRDILSELKIWVVNEIKKSREGHHNIVLNYLGFINQSFNVTFAPASDMIISNKLDEKIISQNFPRLDACTAFSFVLNAETTRKYFSPSSLAQETQATTAVLGNLLDVFQEIQQAKLELQNMTRTAFHCPSDEQLDLHTCFFNFKSGKKAMLTLDLSCLKRGIYPSEIIPSHVATGNVSKNSSVEPMIGEITDAVRGLRTGYSRILRLCRLVSQVVQKA